MNYISTRDKTRAVSAGFAIANGISAEGGLFVPEQIPVVGREWMERLQALDYPARAERVLSPFLTDYSPAELQSAVQGAYTGGVFEHDAPAPLTALSQNRHLLELWHGPTLAFKDLALQLLPRLMGPAAGRTLKGREVLILVATSGDTGKAALEGFCDVPGVRIAVFYPQNGVSPMQRLQMATQEGKNVAVYAIEGNFDDAQTAVKRAFADRALAGELAARNTVLSSANSINWGRLVPQIVYYFSAYADLVRAGRLEAGERVNFVVPTGNFGNILAGWYAAKMGLPVKKLICASNRNNVLTDFMSSGVYDANRAFYATLSPSMDILISSNLERLLFELSGRDDRLVAGWMGQLSKTGRYEVPPALREALSGQFWGGYADDETCRRRIAATFEQDGVAVDPHTAVALEVCEQYRAASQDDTPAVILSTASPYKFAAAVLSAIGGDGSGDEFEAAKRLAFRTKTSVPDSLLALQQAPVRFDTVLHPRDLAREVAAFAAR